jgi:hypothetical protein
LSGRAVGGLPLLIIIIVIIIIKIIIIIIIISSCLLARRRWEVSPWNQPRAGGQPARNHPKEAQRANRNFSVNPMVYPG